MGFSEYPSAYNAVLWMNADFYTRILSQLGNGIIMKNGDDSVTISSTDLIKTQAKMFDMQSCFLLEKALYLVLLMRYIISKSTNLFDKVHVCTLANLILSKLMAAQCTSNPSWHIWGPFTLIPQDTWYNSYDFETFSSAKSPCCLLEALSLQWLLS